MDFEHFLREANTKPDYNTNAGSYYKELARKQELIKLLAKRIWEYDELLDDTLENLSLRLENYINENDSLMSERLKNWDDRIENLDEEVSHIFIEWLEDGTLESIINDDVLGNKADKIETEKYINEKNSIFWKPELKNVDDLTNYTPKEFYSMVEGIDHPYFAVSGLGNDQSNQYSIRKYIYTPENYEETIFLVGGTHGSEVLSVYFIMKLFQMLLDDSGKIPKQFEDLKNKVRIICIPILNPWGMYQTPRTRYNSRGVDLNRNFDWKWETQPVYEPFGYGYKGESPFSEIESRYVRKVLSEYGDISLVLDLHNFGAGSESDPRHYVMYGDNRTITTNTRLLEYLTRDIEEPNVLNIATMNDASLNNYSSGVFNIPSANLEAIPGRYGDMYGIEDTEKWFEMYGNGLIMLTKSFGGNHNFFVRNYVKDNGASGMILANNVETLIGEFDIPLTQSGLITVQGFATASKSDTTSLFSVRPKLEQEGYITQNNTSFSPYTQGSSSTLPIFATIPVRSGGISNAKLKLYAINEGEGVCNVRRYNVQISFVAGLLDAGNSIYGNHSYVVLDV